MQYGLFARRRKLTVASWLLGLALAVVPAAAEEPVTVAVLGDSLVAGYGLAQEEGFVPQMQRWLDARGIGARLINAGVSGDTTAGGLARVAWTLTPEVDALVVSLGGNDVLRGIPPEAARKNLQGILQAARARGLPVLLVGIQAPGNYGPDYKQAFEAIYPDLARRFDTLLYPSFLQALTGNPEVSASPADFLQADFLHPNARGVALIVQDMGPVLADLVALARH